MQGRGSGVKICKERTSLFSNTFVFFCDELFRCGTINKRALQFLILESVYYNPQMVGFSPDWLLTKIKKIPDKNWKKLKMIDSDPSCVLSSSIVRTLCVSRCLLAYSALLRQRETYIKIKHPNWLQPVKFFTSQLARFEVKRHQNFWKVPS